MSEVVLCMHCGEPAGNSPVPGFCCLGCQAVHRILSSGPFSDYYRIRQEGVCFERPRSIETGRRDYSFWNLNSDSPLRIFVEGVHCTACVWLLERLPLALARDVRTSQLDLSRSQLTLELVPGADRERIARTIESFGYRPHLIGSRSEGEKWLELENRKRLIDVGVAGALAGNVMLMSIPLYSGVEGRYQSLFEWVSFALSIPSVFYSGRSFFQNVVSGIRNRIFPIDGPILLAIVTAWLYSVYSLAAQTHDLYFDSLTSLIFLLLSSRYYLSRVRQASGLNAGVLSFFHAPFSGLPGEVVTLSAGESVGFDGRVLMGRAWVDQSHFTGEADPVLLNPGDEVLAGSRIVEADSGLQLRVEQVGSETRLQKLLIRIQESLGFRTRLEQSTERWARWLLMMVLITAVAAMVNFFQMGEPVLGLERVLALLIVTCPCALALATPLVYSLASGYLLKQGVLLKNPEALDRALTVREIYFDKTGTLTYGKLKIARGDLSSLEERELRILSALTERSSHPVSRAIYREIQAGFQLSKSLGLEKWVETPGVGVEGLCEGVRYGLKRNPRENSLGVQFFKIISGDWVEISSIHFEDQIREDSGPVAIELNRNGYHLHLLTGDHLRNAQSVVGNLPFQVSAGLTPAQKADQVSSGMMVGDGVNDALALARAQVGIAVQGGIEAAIESADVYCLKPGISGVLLLLKTASRVRSVLLSNFGISTVYNLAGAGLALTGWMSPLLAAVLMPLSATSVFLHSIWRMRRQGG